MKSRILSLTKNACFKLSTICKEHNTKNILFYVKGGGCNGYNYIFEPLKEKPNKMDEIIKRPDYNLVVCGKSLIHILGIEIDWKKNIMGETFEFNNPMAQSKCGCGTSFSSKASK